MRSIRAPAKPNWANSVRAATRISPRSSVVLLTTKPYTDELVRSVRWRHQLEATCKECSMSEAAVMDPVDIDVIMNQPERVQAWRRVAETVADRIGPLVDLSRPYVDGLENLPTDGRFLLVGNHTQGGV